MGTQFPGLRRLLLFVGDMAIVAVSSYIAMCIVVAYSAVDLDMELYHRMLPVMLSIVGLLVVFEGLLSLKRKKQIEVMLDLAIAMVKMFVIMMAISFFLREFAYSRSILILATIIQFVGLAFWYNLWWQFEQHEMIPREVLVMGSVDENHRLLAHLRTNTYLKDHVKYICPDYDGGQWRAFIKDVDLVILSAEMQLNQKAEMLHYCQINNKQVFILPNFYELYCSKVDLDKIDDIPVFRPRYLGPTAEQRILKRFLDISIAAIATVALIPIFVLIAIAIRVDSPGPIFFTQRRVGQYEKEFSIFKFRTMCVDAEKQTGPVLATVDDPRITRVGRFIRATRIDELPQLINVLIGNMSIVGPRPERAFFVEMLKKELPEYIHRSNVKPGITGMAQVYGKYNTSPYSKLIYDLIYIQKCNVLTDVMIMLKTVRVLVYKEHSAGVGTESHKRNISNVLNKM
ncbi:UDP-N-acetylgalactosamine-undecaprenyl-phosphate N-acetylgalactosaminephosphotransferase [Sporomusa ovata DSM 2662]|uniref:Lipid carrier: UDP-N-acetylgalactosaminyltransferase n=1 Tax=Sporomusa ovata TaxID=2378 RepID=A0A0U1L5C3_9FIRM|nr:sugar transferase [Sporomusa ovata]EQB28547.1 putative colanic biosynthesis UDP-glucose lipid carrier transferase [Sporomusa ovata DSM 2662]CQR74877.1 Lipid carrier : UDP-N-acetylgalactosaminyltransferase [Sporomusa ovata]